MKLIDNRVVAEQIANLMMAMCEQMPNITDALEEHLRTLEADDRPLCEAQLAITEAVSNMADAHALLTGGETGEMKRMIKDIKKALDAVGGTINAAMAERKGLVH